MLINANASAKRYDVYLLLYTSASAATVLDTQQVTTTGVGEGSYIATWTAPVTLAAGRIYGVSIVGVGETYYTTAAYAYTTSTGPGHVTSMLTHAPLVAIGLGGAVVRTFDHKQTNYGGSPPGVPATSLGAGNFNPIKMLFSNAS
ncbi:MAG: hypothetical protein VW547_16580, partial [Alphaproteobacteria bacterium]